MRTAVPCVPGAGNGGRSVTANGPATRKMGSIGVFLRGSGHVDGVRVVMRDTVEGVVVISRAVWVVLRGSRGC